MQFFWEDDHKLFSGNNFRCLTIFGLLSVTTYITHKISLVYHKQNPKYMYMDIFSYQGLKKTFTLFWPLASQLGIFPTE